MAKKTKSRSRRRYGNSRRRRRYSNPFPFARERKNRRYRRRSNPMGFTVRDMGSQLLWGTVGGVATLAVPGLVAATYNTGWTGYLLNGATAWAGSMLLGKMAGPKAGQDFLVGGIVATGLRIFNNFFGSSFPIGLSGLGFYMQNSFPLPTTGSGPFLLNPGYEGGQPMMSIGSGPTPAAVAAAAAAQAAAANGTGSGSDTSGKWGDKWAA